MWTPREVLCRALPRSQDAFVADAILRELAEAGYAIVPRKPTEDMVIAGSLTHNADPRPLETCISAGEAEAIYMAMLAANPHED